MSAQTMGMTDVSGYRSDMGGLGQDQAVSTQLHGILTSKLPLLSSPGTVIENSLYYDVSSSSVSAVEMQETFAKDRITMTSQNFQTAASAYIPSQLFAGTVYWVAQIPDVVSVVGGAARSVNDTDNGAFRFHAPSGWGFNALQSIIIYMGSANIAQIEIDWYANFLVAMACCETKGKREAMIEAAGRYLDNYTSTTLIRQVEQGVVATAFPQAGQSILRLGLNRQDELFAAQAGITPVQNSGVVQSYFLPMTTVCVPIRLPFTSMCALEKKLSLDTKLLTQPIQITLQTKPFTSIFQVGNRLSYGNQWQNSTLQIWQEELSDKSLSVRNELLAAPQFNVGYPFQYIQSIPFTFPTTDNGEPNMTYNGAMFNGQSVTMNITSIINSDLTTMLIMVTNGCRSSSAPFTPGALVNDYSQFCPLKGEQISNIQLLLNGQRFFAFDQGVYEGVSLCKQLDEVTTDILMPGENINTREMSCNQGLNIVNGSQLTQHVTKTHIYELNFSRLRALCCESHLQNTARFTNQTFQLTFNVERSNDYILKPGPSDVLTGLSYANWKTITSNGMSLHMAFCYNGVFLIGGDGGTSKLVTN
jgi:hypothetical protein